MLIYPYKTGSKSAKSLAAGLGGLRIKHVGSRLRGGPNKTVINWGASELPAEVLKCKVINHPDHVARASNKLSAFAAMGFRNVPIVPYTPDLNVAQEWIQGGSAVVCRTITRGSGGRGIEVAETLDQLVNAPLYTRYVKKESEWRIHIVGGGVSDIQRKVRDNRVPDDQVDWRIRNHDRGFIFQRHDINPPVQVVSAAAEAVAALELDFGAVDVIYNAHYQQAYVLEVNCAPGLEGTTLENYINSFRRAV
jgi:glutathione synthase/RimK-type ligase-like ATP-grasp enzyme